MVTDRQTDTQECGQQTTVTVAAHAATVQSPQYGYMYKVHNMAIVSQVRGCFLTGLSNSWLPISYVTLSLSKRYPIPFFPHLKDRHLILSRPAMFNTTQLHRSGDSPIALLFSFLHLISILTQFLLLTASKFVSNQIVSSTRFTTLGSSSQSTILRRLSVMAICRGKW